MGVGLAAGWLALPYRRRWLPRCTARPLRTGCHCCCTYPDLTPAPPELPGRSTPLLLPLAFFTATAALARSNSPPGPGVLRGGSSRPSPNLARQPATGESFALHGAVWCQHHGLIAVTASGRDERGRASQACCSQTTAAHCKSLPGCNDRVVGGVDGVEDGVGCSTARRCHARRPSTAAGHG